MSKKTATLPLEPLWEVARTRSDNPSFSIQEFADMVGTTDRAVSRWRSNGHRVPWVSADRAAIGLGLHPMLVWGDEWINLFSDFDVLEAEAHIEMSIEEPTPDLVTPAPTFDGDNPEHVIAMLTADLNTFEALTALVGTPEVTR